MVAHFRISGVKRFFIFMDIYGLANVPECLYDR